MIYVLMLILLMLISILKTRRKLGLTVPALISDYENVTGRVVGILQRHWRDYVVTFPPREGSQSQSRNSQRILAVPWDRRIPKIRISTQQADALQVWFTVHQLLIYVLNQTLLTYLKRSY